MIPEKIPIVGILFGLLLSLGTLAGTAVHGQIPGAIPAEPTMMDYENSQLGFSIQHPAAWIPISDSGEPLDPQQGVTTSVVSFVTLPEDPQDQFGESVSVIVDEMALSFGLDEYTAVRLPVLGTLYPDINITEEAANVTLAGMPAYQITFDATLNATLTGEPTIDGRVMEIWTVDNNRVYTIHYEADTARFDQLLPQANQMVESFTIQTASNGTGTPVANATDSNMTATAETANGNASGFESARQQLLSVWQETPFNPAFDTFIEPGSDLGYGIYDERGSTVFNPDDTVTLYLEPVGFTHKEVLGEQGEPLYQINLTASVQIASADPAAASALNQTISDIPPIVIVSHRQNTELYMTIPMYLYQAEPPVPEGQYTIAYTITDGETGQSFTIEKDITIAQTVST